MKRLIAWISDLRVAIGLLILIAVASGLGTLVPQKESEALYHRVFDAQPWLGLFNGDRILALQLDHVYSSSWFLALLAWLGLALILCSVRRQWPALQAALRWIDYRTPRQLSKLTLAETLPCADAGASLSQLDQLLSARGWQLQRHDDRAGGAARCERPRRPAAGTRRPGGADGGRRLGGPGGPAAGALPQPRQCAGAAQQPRPEPGERDPGGLRHQPRSRRPARAVPLAPRS